MEIGVGFGTQLWMQWAFIALDSCDDARAARALSGPPANDPELRASMVSILGAALALDGLAADVETLGARPVLARAAPRERAVFVWETLRANFNVDEKTQQWPRALKELWKLRSVRTGGGGLAHPKTVFGDPRPFPLSDPAPARMTYTVEKAIWATALMAEIISHCSVPKLRAGSSGELRGRVQGYESYAREYTERACPSIRTRSPDSEPL